MSNHTPGPHFVEEDLKPGYMITARDGDMGRFEIARVLGPRNNDMRGEMKANAHLYAAAPELLEALKEAQRMILDQGTKGKIPATYENHMVTVRIREAIAKAEGRA